MAAAHRRSWAGLPGRWPLTPARAPSTGRPARPQSRPTIYPQLEAEGVDLETQVPAVYVPVYLAEGRWDLNAPPALAERYLQNLTAPGKHLEWFEHSGHNPCYEESARFNVFMTGVVLAQVTARVTQHR
jgi:pimeloyl-ACP methyl ester carboxylesterase